MNYGSKKLSKEAIAEILTNKGRGGILYKDLAKKYGVHIMTINYYASQSLNKKVKEARKRWNENNKNYIKEQAYQRNQRLKKEVLLRYSSNLECACCGEKQIAFLSIDHIEGGGCQHRKEIGRGNKLYTWLKKNNFPSGFRVLCFNCNHAYGHYKNCPHKLKDMFQVG